MTEIVFDVPNLDGATDPESLDKAEVVFNLLAIYSMHKASAMRCRLSGNTSAAIAYENVCQTIYDKLPQWARW